MPNFIYYLKIMLLVNQQIIVDNKNLRMRMSNKNKKIIVNKYNN